MKVTQLCPTLCDLMDYIVCGVLQARILEWVAFPFSGGLFTTQELNSGLLHCRQILYQLSHQGSPRILEWVAYPFYSGTSDSGIEPGSPALQVGSLPAELPHLPHILTYSCVGCIYIYNCYIFFFLKHIIGKIFIFSYFNTFVEVQYTYYNINTL